MSKLKIILWSIGMFVTSGTFYVMFLGTASPEGTNGNGNPALFVLYATSPFIFVFYYLTTDLIVRLLLKMKRVLLILLGMLGSVIMSVALYFQLKAHESKVRNALENSPNEAYREGWNQFTNSVYFNTYSFSFSMMVCFLFGFLISGIILFAKKF